VYSQSLKNPGGRNQGARQIEYHKRRRTENISHMTDSKPQRKKEKKEKKIGTNGRSPTKRRKSEGKGERRITS